MRTLPTLFTLLIAPLVALSQSSPVRIPGVDEPPELLGEPKTFPTPPEALLQFKTVMDKWNEHDMEKVKALRPELDEFIRQHPDYSDAYTIRAMGDLCYLKSKDYPPIAADIDKAIGTQSQEKGLYMFDLTDLYAIRGKVRYQMGRYSKAMDDLESAVKQKVDGVNRMFMAHGTKPETSDAFLWSKTDI